MKVEITQVFTKERTGKNGKPFTSLSIKTKEHGDRWISGFQNKDNKNWKSGDTVDIEIKENGEYLNFEMPKKAEISNDTLEEIRNMFRAIVLKLDKMETLGVTLRGHTSPTEEYPYGINMENHPLNATPKNNIEDLKPF